MSYARNSLKKNKKLRKQAELIQDAVREAILKMMKEAEDNGKKED